MIALSCDHGGYLLKEIVREYFIRMKIDFCDYGVYEELPTDYPLVVKSPCEDILNGKIEKGIFFCGTGIGVSIAANKHKGIRAACVTESYSAQLAREHNDANVLCLGGRILSGDYALSILEAFLNTPFSNDERHIKRIKMIAEIEK